MSFSVLLRKNLSAGAFFGRLVSFAYFWLLIILGVYLCVRISVLSALMHLIIDAPFGWLWYLAVGGNLGLVARTALNPVYYAMLLLCYLAYYYCLGAIAVSFILFIAGRIKRALGQAVSGKSRQVSSEQDAIQQAINILTQAQQNPSATAAQAAAVPLPPQQK